MTLHVLPVNDIIEHEEDFNCVCGPDVQFNNPETGEFYDDGPIVKHHSLDGRELSEPDYDR